MNQLFLQDFKEYSDKDIRNHLIEEYTATKEDLDKYHILIAYESVGSYGCDSSSWFLLRNKKTKVLYEFSGGHCSCHGFENQYEPEETYLVYLKSDKFYMPVGGYDGYSNDNRQQVLDFIKKMKN